MLRACSQKVLPPEEYAEINWEGFKNNDPPMVPPLLAKIAANDSEIAYRPRPHRLDRALERSRLVEHPPLPRSSTCAGWPVHHAHERLTGGPAL